MKPEIQKNWTFEWGERLFTMDSFEDKVQKLKDVRVFLLDMDGTIFLGEKLLPRAKEFLDYLRSSGRRFIFLTNNSSKDKGSYVEKLKKLGIEAKPEEILTSGEATCIYLKSIGTKRVYLMGTPELENEFRSWGIELTEQAPEYVVLGFDKTLTYHKLVVGCEFLRRGIPFIATHPDFNCPMENTYIPDTGSMIELMKASTGVSPKVIGKPNKEIIESAFKKFNNEHDKKEFAMVGDRVYTDVKTGINAGICAILVLSGESTLQTVEESDVKPTVIAENVGEIMDCLKVIDGKN